MEEEQRRGESQEIQDMSPPAVTLPPSQTVAQDTTNVASDVPSPSKQEADQATGPPTETVRVHIQDVSDEKPVSPAAANSPESLEVPQTVLLEDVSIPMKRTSQTTIRPCVIGVIRQRQSAVRS
eukprot:g4177.t1